MLNFSLIFPAKIFILFCKSFKNFRLRSLEKKGETYFMDHYLIFILHYLLISHLYCIIFSITAYNFIKELKIILTLFKFQAIKISHGKFSRMLEFAVKCKNFYHTKICFKQFYIITFQ